MAGVQQRSYESVGPGPAHGVPQGMTRNGPAPHVGVPISGPWTILRATCPARPSTRRRRGRTCTTRSSAGADPTTLRAGPTTRRRAPRFSFGVRHSECINSPASGIDNVYPPFYCPPTS
ncbi:uncharacterized protein LOC124613373 [Schistocerca americana]|uniref:uncharacterized protein LOC124613373 n=1 Tax=Schistocerca americana TaxID=7009 RepID=UPI001F4F76F3|nr:uncharacterized protein LOC124613373 [Schistocerca americana]